VGKKGRFLGEDLKGGEKRGVTETTLKYRLIFRRKKGGGKRERVKTVEGSEKGSGEGSL